MAKRASPSNEKLPSPNLLIPRETARSRLMERIEIGKVIRDTEIKNKNDLENAKFERQKWSDYNIELLNRIFDNSSIADQYSGAFSGVILFDAHLSHYISDFQTDLNKKINNLESICEKLELIPESIPPAEVNGSSQLSETSFGQNLFLVHGHDTGLKERVARFVEKLGINVVILHEQVNAGRTIIEKFEDHSDVGFAVILLTPDDIGYQKNSEHEKKSRARQNVILEFGFFLGKLGRQRVCALHGEGVELPSDLHGVLYISVDPNDMWKFSLAKEMKQAGLLVDMNKI